MVDKVKKIKPIVDKTDKLLNDLFCGKTVKPLQRYLIISNQKPIWASYLWMDPEESDNLRAVIKLKDDSIVAIDLVNIDFVVDFFPELMISEDTSSEGSKINAPDDRMFI